MSKVCDNKSVGVIIRDGDKFAVIKRKNYPVAYAFVAGHLDGDSFEKAAEKEAKEEANIKILVLEKKLAETLENPCKREGGSRHQWEVFEAVKWEGELRPSSDAKEAFWASLEDLKKLAERTVDFSKKLGIAIDDVSCFTRAVTDDPEWQKDPGLEPVWLVMLRTIGIM